MGSVRLLDMQYCNANRAESTELAAQPPIGRTKIDQSLLYSPTLTIIRSALSVAHPTLPRLESLIDRVHAGRPS